MTRPRRLPSAVSRTSIVLILLSALSFAATPQVSKIEPPNWWTGYVSPVMVLLYGDNLAGASIAVKYPGVSVQKTEVQPDGKHAFVWLIGGKDCQARDGESLGEDGCGRNPSPIAASGAATATGTIPGRDPR